MESFAGAHCFERQTTTERGRLICGCQTSARWLPEYPGLLLQETMAARAPKADKLKLNFFNTVKPSILNPIMKNLTQ